MGAWLTVLGEFFGILDKLSPALNDWIENVGVPGMQKMEIRHWMHKILREYKRNPMVNIADLVGIYFSDSTSLVQQDLVRVLKAESQK